MHPICGGATFNRQGMIASNGARSALPNLPPTRAFACVAQPLTSIQIPRATGPKQEVNALHRGDPKPYLGGPFENLNSPMNMLAFPHGTQMSALTLLFIALPTTNTSLSSQSDR